MCNTALTTFNKAIMLWLHIASFWAFAKTMQCIGATKWCVAVNSRHAWPAFLKFERSFEIHMSVLNITDEISEFP